MPRPIVSTRMTTVLLAGCAISLGACIIGFPDQAFHASLNGLSVWWKLVFPALLPFLIMTELMRAFGMLHLIGSLLTPLMRRLFKLPGISGWVFAMGFTAGMPASAAAVGLLRKDGLLQRDDGERLLAATHVASPVMMITIIGVGFLHQVEAGVALALIHYAAALITAILQTRFAKSSVPAPSRASKGYIEDAIAALHQAKEQDGRTFGKLLGEAVTHSMQQLFVIGGYMMMFSVLLQMISLTGWLAAPYSPDSDKALAGVIAALVEPHLGAYKLAQLTKAGSSLPYVLLSLALAWGGLSTHAQAISLTARTGLRYSRFLTARLLHSGIAGLLALIGWKPLLAALTATQSTAVMVQIGRSAANAGKPTLWPFISPMMLQFGAILLVLLIIAVFSAFIFRRTERRK